MGEFGLIEQIARILGAPGTGVIAGIGDDAAVLDFGGNELVLATVDMLVEGVHFLATAPPAALGRRAVAVNISDIAAMGGYPVAALISVALPADTPERWVLDLYRGMRREVSEFGASVVGGNISRTDGPRCIDVTLLGRVERGRAVRRSGARVGDVLGVTGVLGTDAAQRGTRALGGPSELFVPTPRVACARALTATGRLHAMLDISDGLASDLGHLAAASGAGAVLYAAQVPIAAKARRAGEERGLDPLDLALNGGEDYELLFAAAGEDWPELVEAAGPVPLYQVGTVLAPEHELQLETPGGQRQPLFPRGWTHF